MKKKKIHEKKEKMITAKRKREKSENLTVKIRNKIQTDTRKQHTE